MGKKQRVNGELPIQELEAPPLFRIGTWSGLPIWQCNLCEWDTLDGEAQMMIHLANRHMPQVVERAEPLIKTFNTFGRDTTEEVTDERK
jgi:hypothetical protein